MVPQSNPSLLLPLHLSVRSRIAESNPHAARHLQPLHLAATLADVQAWAADWVQAQAQARLLRDSRPGFLHARILTVFWGFADDFMVSLR
jgi:hypothetical protein